MPIRALCIICSDFLDHSRDVAAIHCGHTFHYECLLEWFQTAPTRTCPHCRKQAGTKHIINRLFFDIGAEDESAADPETLQNELDRLKVLLSKGEREMRDRQQMVSSLKEIIDKQKKDLDGLKKKVTEKEMLCSTLKKQMTYLENKQIEVQVILEEVRRLRTKVQTFERWETVLQGQKEEVESMVTDMGVSQAAVEQLSIYCISLKKEYDNLKGSLKSSNDMCEKLKREVLSSNNKLQKATLEVTQTREDMKSLQKDLTGADKEISSLKKKVEILQKTLSTPTQTNEALSRFVFESPAPLELKQPRLQQPADSEDIDLNITYDVMTPDDVAKKPSGVASKKMRVDPLRTPPFKLGENSPTLKKAREDSALDPFVRNSLLFRKKTFGGMLDPQKKKGTTVQCGYDGLGGRTKFFMPPQSPLAEIRPLIKAKRKKVVRPPPKMAPSLTLDSFLEEP